jgi:SAM-dependent methyltransferase
MDKQYGALYEDLYRRHWWFRAREAILVEVIGTLRLPKPATILDVGCGNGLFFEQLEQFGDVCGIEIDNSLVPPGSRYRHRISDKPLGHPEYPLQAYDLITALDVVEHIRDDEAAVAAMLAMLRPGGTLVMTVPASMLLWDRHDEINQHFRRYSRQSLAALLRGKAKVLRMEYLFHLLFLPKMLVKIRNSVLGGSTAQHGVPSPAVNRWMEAACLADYRFLRPLRVPFGTSLLAVVQKSAS